MSMVLVVKNMSVVMNCADDTDTWLPRSHDQQDWRNLISVSPMMSEPT